MADYHPLDTRYKGPSTSYRGSAHKEPVAVETPKAGPWGDATPSQPAPRPAKRARPFRSIVIWVAIIIGVAVFDKAYNLFGVATMNTVYFD